MRLLHAFSTFELGGPQARFIRLVGRLGADFEHDVLAMDGRTGAAAALGPLRDRVRLLSVPMDRGRHLRNLTTMLEVIHARNPARLLTYNWGALEWALAAAASGLSHVHVEDGFGPDEAERPIRRRSMARAVMLRLSRARVVTVSRTLARVAETHWHLPAHALVALPNGVDVQSYPDVSLRGRVSTLVPADELVIGTVAALRPEKRIDRLLEAFAMACHALEQQVGAPALRLVIGGDGPERAALERRAGQLDLGDAVRFVGHVGAPAELLREFDIFALSSDTEQLPMALLEAMACALPAAATDVGDVRVVLGEGALADGLVTSRDASALAGALAKLACDASLRQRHGATNRRRVQACYPESTMLAGWDALWRGQDVSAAGAGSVPGDWPAVEA